MRFSSALLWWTTFTLVAEAFLIRSDSQATRQSIRLQVTSALEGIIRDGEESAFSWLDPSTLSADDSSSERTLPLYPLPAVYLPTGKEVQYTLNNIEPRNVQMALDVSRFCAVLRTIDTGRMASTGTILRIIDQDQQSLDGQIRRITLTCIAEEIVDILAIQNPEAVEMEYRLQHPREYIRAAVCSRVPCSDNTMDMETIRSNIIHDYNSVRDMLLQGIGTDRLPVSCRDGLSTWLPALSNDSLVGDDDESFWATVFLWQTLCNSFQEGHRSNLIASRNEMLVAAAIAKKNGPLNLPIQLSDLDRSDRETIAELEFDAQNEWVSFGMNPVLDFQRLVQETSQVQRWRYFASMLQTARQKFEQLAQEESISDTLVVEETEPPKGAWFDDSLW